jgi:hypothetical protein
MSRRVRTALWILAIAATAVAVTVVAIPTLYIQPFKPQTSRGLEIAYPLRRVAPVVTLASLVVVGVCGLLLVRGPRRVAAASRSRPRWYARRGVRMTTRAASLTFCVGITTLVTWFSRQNHFEWMFEPLARVEYVGAAEAKRFLTDNEMVMGIEVNGLLLAYPIRQMAYHHVVNDMFGTTPVVVTY